MLQKSLPNRTSRKPVISSALLPFISFEGFLQDFSQLSAETPEGRLAQISPQELGDVAFDVAVKPLAAIRPSDHGDEDRAIHMFDVWANNSEIAAGFKTPQDAKTWAESKGYRVQF